VRFVTGINYPWTLFQGRPNYGCDFGVNIWGSHAGVTAHERDLRRDFATIAGIGVDVVRWSVFTDGRGGVRWDETNRLTALSDGFFDDMDAALEGARAAGLRLCLVLFDYLWMVRRGQRNAESRIIFTPQPDLLTTADGRIRVMEGLLDPMLARYGTDGPKAALGWSIHSIDVINEPDWVTHGLAPNRALDPVRSRRWRPGYFSRAELQAFVRAVADRVHRHTAALVTLGGGRVKFAAEWDDPAYGLDFVQVHSYPDVQHPRRDRSLIGRPCGALTLSKPVLIGEFPANGHLQHPPQHHPPAFSLADYLDLAHDGGYLGAWPWSFTGVDAFGAVNVAEMTAWIRAHDLESRPPCSRG
jgi:hypothetical protein